MLKKTIFAASVCISFGGIAPPFAANAYAAGGDDAVQISGVSPSPLEEGDVQSQAPGGDNTSFGGTVAAPAAHDAVAPFNPHDFVSLREMSLSIPDGTNVLNASGASIGRVRNDDLSREGSEQTIRVVRADGSNVRIEETYLRYNVKSHSLLTNLSETDLQKLSSAQAR